MISQEFEANRLIGLFTTRQQFDEVRLATCQHNAILAGGFLRQVFDEDDRPLDVDLFFRSEKDKLNTVQSFKENPRYKVIFECPEGKLYSFLPIDNRTELKVQLIAESYYESPAKCINSFDINACRIAWTPNTLIYGDRTKKDIEDKKITLHDIKYPVASLKRITKYINKGYQAPSETLEEFVKIVTLLSAIGELDTRIYID